MVRSILPLRDAHSMTNLPRHCKHLENAGFFPAVSELSGSFRERRRLGKNLGLNVLNEAKRLNGLNVLNTRLALFHPAVSRRDQGSISFSAKITKP